MRAAFAIIVILLLPAFLPPEYIEEPPVPEPCNGLSELCNKRYSDVTFPETHNAHSTLDEGFILYAANHRYNLSQQYDAGFRAFMIDAHPHSPETTDPANTSFCHGSTSIVPNVCAMGEVDGVTLLSALHEKMNSTPRDVVTLLLEVAVAYENLEYIFNESGLLQYAFIHEIGAPWPTLQQMIDSDKRLVVFIEAGADSMYPWLHDFNVHSWTTDFAEKSSTEMTCNHLRGDESKPVWHLNNWLSSESGLSTWTGAAEVNAYDFLLQRSLDCWAIHGKRPTFIAVDWWTEGDAVNVARTLNSMNHWSEEPPRLETTDSK